MGQLDCLVLVTHIRDIEHLPVMSCTNESIPRLRKKLDWICDLSLSFFLSVFFAEI